MALPGDLASDGSFKRNFSRRWYRENFSRLATGNFSLLWRGWTHVSHRTEHGGDRQTCARGSCGDTTGAVAPDQPPPATWAGWPGASVLGDTGRVTTVWCQQRPGGQGTPAGAGEQQPGAGPAGGSRRGAVQECRRGAGRQDRRQRRFCSVVLWLEMAAVAHVVTPSQLTLDTGGDLAGSSTAPHTA